RRLWRLEVHQDVDVGHALRGDQIAFVRHGIVGAHLSQRGEILQLRHAARGQPIVNAQEIADVFERVHCEKKSRSDVKPLTMAQPSYSSWWPAHVDARRK